MKNTYRFDFNLNRNLSWFLVIIIPLLIFLTGLTGFVKVMGTAGAVGGGIEGILIGLMYLQVKKKRERNPRRVNKIDRPGKQFQLPKEDSWGNS